MKTSYLISLLSCLFVVSCMATCANAFGGDMTVIYVMQPHEEVSVNVCDLLKAVDAKFCSTDDLRSANSELCRLVHVLEDHVCSHEEYQHLTTSEVCELLRTVDTLLCNNPSGERKEACDMVHLLEDKFCPKAKLTPAQKCKLLEFMDHAFCVHPSGLMKADCTLIHLTEDKLHCDHDDE